MQINKLPRSFKQYFWEVDFNKIDLNKTHPSYIIQRILNFGNEWATKWLLINFDEDVIKQTIRDYRGLSKHAAIYRGKFFKMPKREIMYFKKGFPNPPTRLWPY